ncbi:sigma-70 family RNA polymerase sigma factor [Pseudoroseomonas wenyumeiae]|uniref:Sigma-70 family RNA polymerase sigma factor n=1 Tax=Teichococcus wenyumeiae TaxID=2478470 RepID=A0A3A9JVG2_9PROT|nr:sigma-70 family RNA polymerase sigma factor [Pseudoroseomonas wenyumeiae]RMI25960.1 sigma-70 family RNA polymerase sigma factor [Pseudoroseomonas wenyumeiae]
MIEDDLIACLPDLRAYARSLTRNRHDADDLVQDTVVRIMNSADRFQPGTNFKAWAFTILRNRFLNEFVAKRKQTRDMDDSEMEQVPTSARQEEGLELADFQRIFHQLPEDHRSILALVAGSGMAYEDVARVLDCAVGTVKSRVHRARMALYTLLEQEAAAGGKRERFHRTPASEERRRLEPVEVQSPIRGVETEGP